MCFCINNAFGYVSENVANGCVGTMNANAIFQVNTYQCGNGFYLPANAESCEACPNLYTCPGGSFTFNEENSQGLMADGLILNDVENGCGLYVTRLTARFTANTYTCSAGYYLPANGIECAVCPNNNYCPGGTYTYSETVTQGIMECPTGLISPIGVSDAGGCGYKLHIGDDVIYLRSSKKTTSSLNIDINNDGIADFFGNATLQRTTINSTSQRYLHVGEYYIYDDSIRLEE